ncbi:hypothetical protein [Pseudobacteroides cellulosolvens]|uniref:Uncharacterized protein n=1 Tax=Pseudobacteroides cellulosolvens ATCC 35603 = DSM 2933 TaxID=398512 RepID=A0A0L6JGY8_9FIRM|nr:hypothetical protein [Pseudobacteroides cellulosolvens]KNY24975.1 hypothetical protein Bccel_0232 [Pseudobacteroides cellulosolvens ATCC 35603 = DSM 2933]
MEFYIMDENGNYTFKDGIKKVGKDFYYNPTKQPERGYLTEDIATEAVSKLELHNQAGNLGHTFKIIKSTSQYVIMEGNSNTIVDENCFVKESKDKWKFVGVTGYNKERSVTTYIIDRAEEVLNKLQGIGAGLNFYIREVKDIPFNGQVITMEV